MKLKHIGLIGIAASVLVGELPVAPATAEGAMVAARSGEDLDRVTFKDGRVIIGKILTDTGSTITIEAHMKVGSIRNIVTTTYDMRDIAQIERGVVDSSEGLDDGSRKDDEVEDAGPIVVPGGRNRIDLDLPDGTTSYLYVEFTGEFGRDITRTPIRRFLDEAKRYQPDVIVIKIDCEYSFQGVEKEDFDPTGAGNAFNQLETVRELQTILVDDVRDDPEWEKKPRLVFWVKKALGGIAFLPFVAKDVYFHEDGRHGGIGYLEYIFGQTGDEVVREKQYSLRLKRAEGLAIKGGHDYHLIRAMAYVRHRLATKIEGGKVVLFEGIAEGPGETQITDDGGQTIGSRDDPRDIIRYKGDDVLTLDADLAKTLGFSRGTVNRLDDLIFDMGHSRTHYLIESRANGILERWSNEVDRAEQNFRRVFQDFATLRQDGDDYKARTKYRGTQIRLLREMKSILDRYGEALNPREISGDPTMWDVEISVMIDQIQQMQRLDRPDRGR